MAKNVVAMPVIPGQIRRGRFTRPNLAYAKYSMATWRWWCEKNGIEFMVVDSALGGPAFLDMPPTVKRWLIPELLIRDRSNGTRVAIVDADTMIRWDAPDFLASSDAFCAVHGRDRPWISRSIKAFQPLFPGVSLDWQNYFNAGVVVVGERQLQQLRSFLEFTSNRWPELKAIIHSGNFGTDQTPLNFIMRREKTTLNFLPTAFNMLHCFPMDPLLFALDNGPSPDPIQFASHAFGRKDVFSFCKRGYVWHFSNVVTFRSLVMREVWSRVSHNYPGVLSE